MKRERKMNPGAEPNDLWWMSMKGKFSFLLLSYSIVYFRFLLFLSISSIFSHFSSFSFAFKIVFDDEKEEEKEMGRIETTK